MPQSATSVRLRRDCDTNTDGEPCTNAATWAMRRYRFIGDPSRPINVRACDQHLADMLRLFVPDLMSFGPVAGTERRPREIRREPSERRA
jgi:hypothetical protein